MDFKKTAIVGSTIVGALIFANCGPRNNSNSSSSASAPHSLNKRALEGHFHIDSSNRQGEVAVTVEPSASQMIAWSNWIPGLLGNPSNPSSPSYPSYPSSPSSPDVAVVSYPDVVSAPDIVSYPDAVSTPDQVSYPAEVSSPSMPDPQADIPHYTLNDRDLLYLGNIGKEIDGQQLNAMVEDLIVRAEAACKWMTQGKRHVSYIETTLTSSLGSNLAMADLTQSKNLVESASDDKTTYISRIECK